MFASIQNPLTQRDLEAAIANVTRALATATGEAVVTLVSERSVLRAKLARAVVIQCRRVVDHEGRPGERRSRGRTRV